MASLQGSVVKYAEPADDYEVSARFVVVEDNGDRVFMKPLGCTLPIVPTILVRSADLVAA